MASVGRVCLYCSQVVTTEDVVKVCGRCLAVHHEECWDRNGRCSTFRCVGVPQTMRGDAVLPYIQATMERDNEQPGICPLCGSRVYAGVLQGSALPPRGGAAQRGLVFQASTPAPKGSRSLAARVLRRIRPAPKWVLAAAAIRARSCGHCRRVFLWGMPLDASFIEQWGQDIAQGFCPHCGEQLSGGRLLVDAGALGRARFECDGIPTFHKDWFGHHVVDRFFLRRWPVKAGAIPAASCPSCHYTEVAGRPVYRLQ